MRLDPELARRAFEALETPLSLEQRVGVRLPDRGRQHRRGGHERRGPPRRRPARLHARRLRRRRPDAPARRARPAAGRARRRPAAPRACSRRSGLLSTDLVYYEQPQRLRGAEPRQRGADRGRLRSRWSARCASASARRPTASPCAAASTGACSARAGRRRSSRCRDGPITAETMPALVERFHEAYERRYGNRFPYVPVQGVTYRVQLVVPAEKIEYVARERSPASRRRRPTRTVELRHLADEPLEAGRVRARGACRSAPSSHGPGDHPRGAVDHRSSCPGQVAEVGRFGEIVDRAARRMIRDLDDDAVRRALRLRPLHRHRAGQPLRLRRRAHVQPAADGGLLADPARLLRLRRHDRRPAGVGLRDAGDEQQHRALHRAR